MADQKISYPLGAADVQSPAFAATLAVTLTNQLTILLPGQMTGAMTVNLTLDQGIRAGARLIVTAASDGTARNITWGTGFSMATALAGVISKTKSIEFVYDGTSFKPTSGGVQID
jgi:hypothetical protein